MYIKEPFQNGDDIIHAICYGLSLRYIWNYNLNHY